MSETRRSTRPPVSAPVKRLNTPVSDEVSDETLVEVGNLLAADRERYPDESVALPPSGNTYVDDPTHLDNAITNATVSPPIGE